jgi:hypothetical protein
LRENAARFVSQKSEAVLIRIELLRIEWCVHILNPAAHGLRAASFDRVDYGRGSIRCLRQIKCGISYSAIENIPDARARR